MLNHRVAGLAPNAPSFVPCHEWASRAVFGADDSRRIVRERKLKRTATSVASSLQSGKAFGPRTPTQNSGRNSLMNGLKNAALWKSQTVLCTLQCPAFYGLLPCHGCAGFAGRPEQKCWPHPMRMYHINFLVGANVTVLKKDMVVLVAATSL